MAFINDFIVFVNIKKYCVLQTFKEVRFRLATAYEPAGTDGYGR